jgi:hypothetical protein
MIRTGPITFLLPLALAIPDGLTVAARGSGGGAAAATLTTLSSGRRRRLLAQPARPYPDIGSHTTSSGESND